MNVEIIIKKKSGCLFLLDVFQEGYDLLLDLNKVNFYYGLTVTVVGSKLDYPRSDPG